MMYGRCRAASSVLLAAQPFKIMFWMKLVLASPYRRRHERPLRGDNNTPGFQARGPASKSADLDVILTGAEPGEASGSDTLRSAYCSSLAASDRAGRQR